jgi:hypothetical protein
MVSSGWQTLLSTKPAQPPAIKCCSGCFFSVVVEEEEEEDMLL